MLQLIAAAATPSQTTAVGVTSSFTAEDLAYTQTLIDKWQEDRDAFFGFKVEDVFEQSEWTSFLGCVNHYTQAAKTDLWYYVGTEFEDSMD